METNRNPVGLIIGALICIVIGIASCQIAYETYEKIDAKIIALNDSDYTSFERSNNSIGDWRASDWKRDVWYKTRTRQESSQYAILYASSFIFSMSLCCFTYICVKSYS